MGKYVVVSGAKVEITSGTGDASITSTPSQYVKINGKGVYKGTLDIKITGYSGTGFVNGNGSGQISPDSLYTKVDGEKVTLLGASATFTVSAQTTSSPPSQIEVPCTVVINDAGQTEVTAE